MDRSRNLSRSRNLHRRKNNEKLQNRTNLMYRQARLSVIASIQFYRALWILLQEYFSRNLFHPAALQQLQDFLYAINYYDTVLHNIRRSNSFLNLHIIEVQPLFPGINPKQQPARRPTTTLLAIVTSPSFLWRNKKKEMRRKRKILHCLLILKLF